MRIGGEIKKLVGILEDFPKNDFGAVTSRIEDASTTTGIMYKEAVQWISNRQSVLTARDHLENICPRTRPVYKSSVIVEDVSVPRDEDSNKPFAPNASQAAMQKQIGELTQSMTILLAAKQRQQPNGERPPLEKCPQTPGLYLRRIASKCRADGCATNSRS